MIFPTNGVSTNWGDDTIRRSRGRGGKVVSRRGGPAISVTTHTSGKHGGGAGCALPDPGATLTRSSPPNGTKCPLRLRRTLPTGTPDAPYLIMWPLRRRVPRSQAVQRARSGLVRGRVSLTRLKRTFKDS